MVDRFANGLIDRERRGRAANRGDARSCARVSTKEATATASNATARVTVYARFIGTQRLRPSERTRSPDRARARPSLVMLLAPVIVSAYPT